VVQPAPDFKPINMGLRKRASFSAIRTKHKASLDMLSCVSKQLPINEETPLRTTLSQQHLNEITKEQTRENRAVNFRNERKKTNHKQHDKAILN